MKPATYDDLIKILMAENKILQDRLAQAESNTIYAIMMAGGEIMAEEDNNDQTL